MDTMSYPIKSMFFLLFMFIYQKNSPTLAADSIATSLSLSGDQTIVSAGGTFALGFFQPGNASSFYIGMWYNQVPQQTIVWVANREQPVSDKFSSVLKISDGNLVLYDEKINPIWSTNVASDLTLGTSMQAVLLDDGNFVLRPESGSSHPLWQSFDHPTHTLIPGSKIGINRVTKQSHMLISWKNSENPAPGPFSLELDPNSSSYILKWNKSIQYWTSGSWDENQHTFSLIPEMGLSNIYNFSYVINENESYFTYSLYDASYTSLLTLDITGQMKQQSWLKPQGWISYWAQPKKQCDVYGLCGAFSSCNEKSIPLCKCIMGFEPKSATPWELKEYNVGCSRKTRLKCGNVTGIDGMNDKFLKVSSTSSSYKTIRGVYSIEDCESICLKDCNCTAYGYSSFSSDCSTWKGDLLLNEAGSTVQIRLAASDYKNLEDRRRTILFATVPATATLLIIVFGYFLWKKKLRNPSGTIQNISTPDMENDAELTFFTLRSILVATDRFSEANKLGEGGFGPVYMNHRRYSSRIVLYPQVLKAKGHRCAPIGCPRKNFSSTEYYVWTTLKTVTLLR